MDRDFMIGASIAAYQTDGCDNTQWHKWEVENASRLSLESGKYDQENYICKDSIKHRENYKSDFKLLKKIGLNTFRYSIEWARIEPEQGVFDEKEIEFQKQYLKEMKKQGLTPILTLWHWTMPNWFVDLGDFENKNNIPIFINFAKRVLTEFKDEVEYIITLNESNVYVFNGYVSAEWPPAKKNYLLAIKVAQNLVNTHKQVYLEAKKINTNFKISHSQNGAVYRYVNNKIRSKILVKILAFARDDFFMNRSSKFMDFIGLNWYNTDYFNGFKLVKPKDKVNDMGWYMEPKRIGTKILEYWRKFKLPIIVTENGLADDKDVNRKWWIEETFKGLRNAKAKGAKILGYCHWTAFDNFEWDKGFWPKFGLIAVDRSTMKRKIRQSAKILSNQVL